MTTFEHVFLSLWLESDSTFPLDFQFQFDFWFPFPTSFSILRFIMYFDIAQCLFLYCWENLYLIIIFRAYMHPKSNKTCLAFLQHASWVFAVWLIEKLQKFHFNQRLRFYYCFSIYIYKTYQKLQDVGRTEYSARRIITMSTENLRSKKNIYKENLFCRGKGNTRRSISGKYIYI